MTPKEVNDLLDNLDDYAGQGCDASGAAECIRTLQAEAVQLNQLASQHDRLQKELQDVTAKALAAVWLLVQEGIEATAGLQALHDRVLELRNQHDGDTAKVTALRENIDYLQKKIRVLKHSPSPGVNAVYGLKTGGKAGLRYVLPLLRVAHAMNDGLEIEVQLP